MKQYTYELLVANKKERREFFQDYERLTKLLKEYGFLEAARLHAFTRKRLIEEVELFD
ncbi:hypothetical protein [Sinorhizobium fredii]|uniref:hypothetical protein n=1 Tax=Rhizobium fredii TaxID=380 RepID=UPI00351634B7